MAEHENDNTKGVESSMETETSIAPQEANIVLTEEEQSRAELDWRDALGPKSNGDVTNGAALDSTADPNGVVDVALS